MWILLKVGHLDALSINKKQTGKITKSSEEIK
jgi:hypothetical protein